MNTFIEELSKIHRRFRILKMRYRRNPEILFAIELAEKDEVNLFNKIYGLRSIDKKAA